MTGDPARAERSRTVLVLRHNPDRSAAVLDRAGTAYLVTDEPGDGGADAAPRPGGNRAQHVARRIALSRYARVYRVSSIQSIEELSAVAADLLVTGAAIDKVVAYSEQDQYAAAYLSHLLGTGGYSPVLSLNTRDKRAMKLRAAAAGLPLPRYLALSRDVGDGDLDRIEAAVGYPLVLKPANGWGTVQTTLVRDRAGLVPALDNLDLRGGLSADHLLVEEFIAGDEFHVDAVWRDGKPWVFFVSRYFTPRLGLTSGAGLNGSILLREDDHPDLYRRMLDLNTRYNAAVGLDRGATHLEVFREHGTGRHICSEIASRPGGANVGELIGVACGVSQHVVWAHELLDGRLADLPPLRRTYPGCLAWLNVPPPRPGRVRSVPDRRTILAHPNVLDVTVRLAPGRDIPVITPSTWGLLLVVTAETEAQLTAAAAELVATIEIQMD
jgi:hypothetical protein